MEAQGTPHPVSPDTSSIPQLLSIPSSLSGVTPAWLSSTISRPIDPLNFIITPNAQDGSGFLSQMLRISCQTLESPLQNLHLIIKFLPGTLEDSIPSRDSDSTVIVRQMCIDDEMDETEINFYNLIAPDLTSELSDLQKYFCPSYLASVIQSPRNSILILEDFKPRGYAVKGFQDDLTPDEVVEVTKFMAKFHYASTLIELKGGRRLDEIYEFLKDERETLEEGTDYNYCMQQLEQLDNLFEEMQCSESMRKNFSRILLGDKSKILKMGFWTGKQLEFGTLIHGDLWSGNILLKTEMAEGNSNESSEFPFLAIDWQFLSYGDPVLDLAVFILSCLPSTRLCKENVDKLLLIYFNTFKQCCGRSMQVLRRDFEGLSKFFYTLGACSAFVWFVGSQYSLSVNKGRLVKIYEFLAMETEMIEFLEKTNI